MLKILNNNTFCHQFLAHRQYQFAFFIMHFYFSCFFLRKLCHVFCQFVKCKSCFHSVRKCDLISNNKEMNKVISEAEKLNDEILQICIHLIWLKTQWKFWLRCLKSFDDQESQNILKIEENKTEIFISSCIAQEFTLLFNLFLNDFLFFDFFIDETVAENDSNSLDSSVVFKYFHFSSILFIWSSIVDLFALEFLLPQICLLSVSDSEMHVVLMFSGQLILVRICGILNVFWCQVVSPICSLLISWLS